MCFIWWYCCHADQMLLEESSGVFLQLSLFNGNLPNSLLGLWFKSTKTDWAQFSFHQYTLQINLIHNYVLLFFFGTCTYKVPVMICWKFEKGIKCYMQKNCSFNLIKISLVHFMRKIHPICFKIAEGGKP